MIAYILAAIVWCIAFGVFKYRKGNPYKEILWGKPFIRKTTTEKAEIHKIGILQDGGGYIDLLIPSIKGCVSIQVEQNRLDELAKKIDVKAIEADGADKVKVLLNVIQLGEKSYIAKIPSGNLFYLGNAVIIKNRKKKNEYDIEDLCEVDERIKSILYNRNALLIVGAILVFANPIFSAVSSLISTFLSVKNVPFSAKDGKEFEGWDIVDTKNYPKQQSQDTSTGRPPTQAEKTINEIKDSIGVRIPCPNCGVILTGEDWQYCPHCGVHLGISEVTDNDINPPPEEEPDLGSLAGEVDMDNGDIGDIPDDLEYPEDENLDDDMISDMPMDSEMDAITPEADDAEEFDPDESVEGEDDIELLDVDEISEMDSDDIEPMGKLIEGDFREVSNSASEFSKKGKKGYSTNHVDSQKK